MIDGGEICDCLRTGALFGGMRLLRELGEGGMGVVWLAKAEALGREVAVKVLRMSPDLPPDARKRGRERFLREARTMASFRHPSILPVYSVGEDPASGLLFFTMEPCLLSETEVARLCDDCLKCPLPADLSRWSAAPSALTLADVVAHNAVLSPQAVARIGCEIADALGYAHGREKAVIHRDVKPSNILFDGTGHLRLVDFGIARRIRSGEVSPTTVSITPVFSNGERPFIGTVEYAAPEQRERNEPCEASDFYSLGLVLYRALVGRMPGTLTPPSKLDPGRIAPGWDSLFAGLLEINPAMRLADPAAIKAKLMKVGRLAKSKGRPFRRAVVSLAVILLVVVLLVAVRFVSRGGAGRPVGPAASMPEVARPSGGAGAVSDTTSAGVSPVPATFPLAPDPGMIWTSDADGQNFRQIPREKMGEEIEKLLQGYREKYPEPVIDSYEWQEEANRRNFVPPYPAPDAR